MFKSLRLRRSVLDCWLLQLLTALGFHFRLIDGNHDHRWKVLCQQSPIFLNAKTLSTINRSCTRQSQCAFPSEHTKLKKIRAAEMHQTITQTWRSVIRLQRQPNPRGRCASASSAALVFSSGSWRSSLQIAPSFANWSDDGGWAGGGRVWVGRGGKVPEEPLAFTLAPLVQVVLLVPLLACSLVVVVLFQVPHRWPAVLLKVLLVLCIRTICLRDGRGCNVFQDEP